MTETSLSRSWIGLPKPGESLAEGADATTQTDLRIDSGHPEEQPGFVQVPAWSRPLSFVPSRWTPSP